MKINKFFMGLGAIAALSMAACSNDEPANPGNGDNPAVGQDQAFITVSISEQTDGKSRAAGDINQPGDGENTGNWFEDGYQLGESKVKSCDFYFYSETGKYVMSSNTLWADNGQNMPNIELKGKSVVVLDKVKEKGYPKYMVAILNKPAGFQAPLTLEEMNTKLVNIANVTTTDGAVKNGEHFTMTTTSWAGQTMRDDKNKALPYYFVNELTADDFYTSAEAAKAEGKAVKVYVERLAAKAAVKIGMESVEDLDNTFALELSVAGAGNDDEGDYVADYELYVELSGWSFNATAKDSYYMKNIDETWTNDALGFMWNSKDYFRSYWGKSYTYGVGTQADYNYFSYNELTNKFWEADEVGKQHAAYTAENTHPADFINKAANYNKVTSVLLKARVYDPNAAEGESSNFVMYNGLIFKGDRFMQYAMSEAEANIWVKVAGDEEKYVEASEGYDLNNDGKGNKVYAVFAPVAGTTYYKKTTNAEGKTAYVAYGEEELASVVEALNEALQNTVGEGFKGGMMYYNVPIRHLRTIGKGADGILERTFAKANLLEGDYGVVRNHYYRISINSLAKLGTGVWNPDEDIVPENPPKDEEYYVGAEINVLSWRIVDQPVDL